MENKKEKLSQAKAYVVSGATLKEASQKTGLSIDVLKRQSSKEKWLDLQEDYFLKMTNSLVKLHGEEHIKTRANAIKTLSTIIEKTAEEVGKEEIDGKKLKIYSDVVSIITKATEGQASLMEIKKINDFSHDEYIKNDLELKKQKNKSEMERFLITSKLKELELLSRDKEEEVNTNYINKFEKEMNSWALEVWGEQAETEI